jgi:NADPH2:quinone reductase
LGSCWDHCGFGKKVIKWRKGDEVFVYCRKPILQWGSWAEFLNIRAEDVALKPKNLSMAEAAAIPLAGLTAWQALFDKGRIKEGQTVLIHAGAGGVGGFAIQWAKLHGAHVIHNGECCQK